MSVEAEERGREERRQQVRGGSTCLESGQRGIADQYLQILRYTHGFVARTDA